MAVKQWYNRISDMAGEPEEIGIKLCHIVSMEKGKVMGDAQEQEVTGRK